MDFQDLIGLFIPEFLARVVFLLAFVVAIFKANQETSRARNAGSFNRLFNSSNWVDPFTLV